jgi:hypothetical protein
VQDADSCRSTHEHTLTGLSLLLVRPVWVSAHGLEEQAGIAGCIVLLTPTSTCPCWYSAKVFLQWLAAWRAATWLCTGNIYTRCSMQHKHTLCMTARCLQCLGAYRLGTCKHRCAGALCGGLLCVLQILDGGPCAQHHGWSRMVQAMIPSRTQQDTCHTVGVMAMLACRKPRGWWHYCCAALAWGC